MFDDRPILETLARTLASAGVFSFQPTLVADPPPVALYRLPSFDTAAAIRLPTQVVDVAGVQEFQAQVLVRGKTDLIAGRLKTHVIDRLHDRTYLAAGRFVISHVQFAYQIDLGPDDNNRPTWAVNFNLWGRTASEQE